MNSKKRWGEKIKITTIFMLFFFVFFPLRRRKFTSCFDARVHGRFTPTARAKQNVWTRRCFNAGRSSGRQRPQTVSQISNPIHLEFISSYVNNLLRMQHPLPFIFRLKFKAFHLTMSCETTLWITAGWFYTYKECIHSAYLNCLCNGLWLICREKLTIYLKSYGDACGYVWSATRG